MEIEYKAVDGKNSLVVRYAPSEWEKLKENFESLGLYEATTENGLGRGLTLKYYRDTEGNFRESLLRNSEINDLSNSIIDDINSSTVVNNQFVNLAVLRIIPDENNEVIVPVSKFITVKELNNFATILARAAATVLSVARPAKIKISFKN